MEFAGAIIFCPREGNGAALMLENLLFSPAALWLAEALRQSGTQQFFVVCHEDDRARVADCFPERTEIVTTGSENATERMAAFLEVQTGGVVVVTRPVLILPERPAGQADIGETGEALETGVFRINAGILSEALAGGADFETILRTQGVCVGQGAVIPLKSGGQSWMLGEMAARQAGAQRLVDAGVRVMDPASVYIDPCVTVGAGTVLLPGAILRGRTVIGSHCEIGPNSMIRDCTVGDNVIVNASQINESTVEEGSKIGPFAYIRPNCHVGRDVKVGDFVEIKNSVIGDGTKISHLTYVGDSDVGGHVNFGCGTVTVNYDGTSKFRTTIGENAFIGCNTNLVAPVKVGDGAYTAAGSTITDDVPGDSLAIARAQQVVKKQWAAKRRK